MTDVYRCFSIDEGEGDTCRPLWLLMLPFFSATALLGHFSLFSLVPQGEDQYRTMTDFFAWLQLAIISCATLQVANAAAALAQYFTLHLPTLKMPRMDISDCCGSEQTRRALLVVHAW
jgi:hypothetical protein